MNNELERVRKELAEKELEIVELKNRLKLSYNADTISSNQKVLTLKNDIKNGLKLQYKDFEENKGEPCNDDNYEALKTNLKQVFRILNKYGIQL